MHIPGRQKKTVTFKMTSEALAYGSLLARDTLRIVYPRQDGELLYCPNLICALELTSADTLIHLAQSNCKCSSSRVSQ